MRVLIAPDKFAGTLTAVEAAAAIEEGWRRRDPEAEVLVAPMADGGPGFIDVLSAVVDGTLLSVTVRGPLGDDTPATVLLAGETAYVETAQACGLHLVEPKLRRPEDATEDDVLTRIAYAPENDGRSVARMTLERIFGSEQPSTRTMAVLHLLDGHTLEEVAEITGMSVSGVRKRLRGLQAHVNELESIQEGVQ